MSSTAELRCETRSWRLLSMEARANPSTALELKKLLDSLTDDELGEIEHNTVSGGPIDPKGNPTPWWTVARNEQIPPESLWIDKLVWVILAGRGWGKTRTGAEWVRSIVKELPGSRGAFIAKDPGEARDVMIEGISGIMACYSKHDPDRPIYNPSLKRITWPRSGTIAGIFSSEDYEELRGPQHHWVWCDELPKWRNAEETWEQVQFGLRLGQRPRACITSTPRPIKVLKEIINDPNTVITKGKTTDNMRNLSPLYMSMVRKYQGTRLGRQELDAEILDDVPGALWTYKMIDAQRIWQVPADVHLVRATTGVDPSVSADGNEAGVITAARGSDGRYYVFHDGTIRGRPTVWAESAVKAYNFFKCDRIIAETNNGGQMVEDTIHAQDPSVPVRQITASRGKITRAEPVALLYERGLVSHVGSFPELEDEMCTYQELDIKGASKFSPNRMDALVWAIYDLMERGSADFEEDTIVVGGDQTTRHSEMHL